MFFTVNRILFRYRSLDIIFYMSPLKILSGIVSRQYANTMSIKFHIRYYFIYFQWVFLPDPSTRKKLTLPPKVQVDYRAACFCHRNLIDIGYVCSVCLSSKYKVIHHKFNTPDTGSTSVIFVYIVF